MIITISKDSSELVTQAAHFTAVKLKEAIHKNGEARMVVSTGASQFETFQALLKEEIDWENIEVFHLDEYIGLPIIHEASFRKYLNDRFVSHVKLKKFHSVDVENDINKKIQEPVSYTHLRAHETD